jgi:alpha-tubulin suppressor-like RCC1 family protein
MGSNAVGQLGDGTTEERDTPTPILSGLAGFDKQDIKGFYPGKGTACAIDNSDTLYCWGFNGYGQIGNGTTGTDSAVPVAVSAGSDGFDPSTVKSVSPAQTTCAITTSNKLFCWGLGSDGALGDDTGVDADEPVAVLPGSDGFDPDDVKEVTIGSNHVCATTNSNELFCWGGNFFGQLGDGNTSSIPIPTPKPVSSGSDGFDPNNINKIGSGAGFTCATDMNNKLYCWGRNNFGQLGNGDIGNHAYTPVAVLPGSDGFDPDDVLDFDTGNNHVCAVDSSLKAFCWGSNTDEQLGDDTGVDADEPVAVLPGADGFKPDKIKLLSAGTNFSCAIDESDRVFCWGANGDGQYGDGSTTPSSTPVLAFDPSAL